MKGDYMTKPVQGQKFKVFRDDILGDVEPRDDVHKEKILKNLDRKSQAKQNFIVGHCFSQRYKIVSNEVDKEKEMKYELNKVSADEAQNLYIGMATRGYFGHLCKRNQEASEWYTTIGEEINDDMVTNYPVRIQYKGLWTIVDMRMFTDYFGFRRNVQDELNDENDIIRKIYHSKDI
jgi:hypothetical protein